MEYKDHIIDSQHPYPGLFSFRENDSGYFFGRRREIDDLFGLINQKVLTIVFGKSGVGKTSLLRAGLIPKLWSNSYLPVYLRIDFENPVKPPIVQVKEAIERKIKEVDSRAETFGNLTMWEYFSSTKISKGSIKHILIFDQFEEIFIMGKNKSLEKNEFVMELADLIEDRVPKIVQERMEKEKKKIPAHGRDPGLKVIFSLREDYLPQLEEFYPFIPSVRFNRFRVSLIKQEDAVEVVENPAIDILESHEVAEEIVKKIPSASDVDYKPFEALDETGQAREIEPFLLSLFCYRANEKRLKNREKVISMELIRGMSAEDIINDYYEENISEFHLQVKRAIEDLLLTPQGYRKLQEMNSLKESDYQVTDEDIEKLVDRRIIRKETRSGIEYVELIHDVLAPILRESRDKRKEKEEAQKKKKKILIIAFASLLLVIIAVLILINLLLQAKIESEKKIADFKNKKAIEEKQRADKEEQKRLAYGWASYSIDLQERDRELSFRLAEYACRQEKKDPLPRRALLSVYYEGGFYRDISRDRGNEFSQTKSNRSDFFAVFSPNGKKILTVTSTEATLWNWDGKKVDKDIKHPPLELERDLQFRPNASFSPDGNYIIFCTKEDEKIVLWDISTNKGTIITFEWGINSVAFSPSKNNINFITACRDSNIRLYNLKGELKKTFPGHKHEVNSAVFSKDGKSIISGCWDRTALLWKLDESLPKTLNDDYGIKTAAFSPDGQWVITGSVDGSVRLWDLNNLDKPQTLGKHEASVTSAVFSPDGQYILTGGDDKKVRLLTLNNYLVMEFMGIKGTIHRASFSPDGKYILIAPACGPAELRPVDPELIIDIVNNNGNVRQVTEAERVTYNLHKTQAVKK